MARFRGKLKQAREILKGISGVQVTGTGWIKQMGFKGKKFGGDFFMAIRGDQLTLVTVGDEKTLKNLHFVAVPMTDLGEAIRERIEETKIKSIARKRYGLGCQFSADRVAKLLSSGFNILWYDRFCGTSGGIYTAADDDPEAVLKRISESHLTAHRERGDEVTSECGNLDNLDVYTVRNGTLQKELDFKKFVAQISGRALTMDEE